MLMDDEKVPSEVTEKVIRTALTKFYWEGRMEEIAPHIYVDGAHNVEAISAYVETMVRLHGGDHKILVFAAVKDKDYSTMIQLLTDSLMFDHIIVTSVDSSRRADASALAKLFRENTDADVTVSDVIDDAMDIAVSLRQERDDTNIYCVGSLYLVGGVKRWRNKHDQF